MTQETLMTHDPATGEPRPYPSHAGQWRMFHGYATAWLFNPWTGDRRSAGDVGSDTLGRAIVPRGEVVDAAMPGRPAVCQVPLSSLRGIAKRKAPAKRRR